MLTLIREFFDTLNDDYMKVHKTKEDLFWTTYMGTGGDRQEFSRAERAWNDFISDPRKLEAVREKLNQLTDISPGSEEERREKKELETGLNGWLELFQANVIEGEEAAALMKQVIDDAAELFERRGSYKLAYTDAQGREQEGSLPSLMTNIRTSDSEQERKSSHQALLDLEQWVLENGFLELVKLRNRLARSMGYANYFEASVRKIEHMSVDELFAILEDFESRTRERNLTSIEELKNHKGKQALEGHNFSFSIAGDVMREMDPYFPFSRSLERWITSFSRLNIGYSGAELTLDLLDRKGKYQNGFCHGPIPAYFNNGTWVPGKINFTSNATPSQVGSGYRGINTFFHEGGHAANFANVKMNAPCFSQEFAPTSMAYAETQSMFCDSILNDGDWLKLYARNNEGRVIPDDLIRSYVESQQPFRAFGERSILVVPYFERALYELKDEELTPERVTALARSTEKHILGLEVSPRPLLAIPHLLSNESACSYQGYLLAHMAVFQTRAHFMKEYGYLADNPHIGPLLAERYWMPGNSLTHDETIRSLTGEGFNAKYLADVCNMDGSQAWAAEEEKIRSLSTRPAPKEGNLDARITVVDGERVLADNGESNEKMCEDFRNIIETEFMS